MQLLDSVGQDVRFAVRSLRATPLFTATAIVLLALSVGGVAAIFSALDAALRRPLRGIDNDAGLVWLVTTSRTRARTGGLSYPDFESYRAEGSAVLSAAALYDVVPLHLGGGGEPARIQAHLVAGDYFQVLGVRRPELGRFFDDVDVTPLSDQRVIVLSHALWQSRFGGDASLVGRSVVVNGSTFVVIGVAGEGFAGPELGASADAWVPMGTASIIAPGRPALTTQRAEFAFRAIARLRPDVSREAAEQRLSAVARNLAAEYAATHEDVGIGVRAVRGGTTPDTRGEAIAIGALLTFVALVIQLIACMNIANLLIARAVRRGHEVGIRLAIGASRARLLRMFVTEGSLLALAGAVCGVTVSLWVVDLLGAGATELRGLDLAPDARLIGFSLVVTVLTGLLFGAAPALHAIHHDLTTVLRDQTRTVAGGRRRRRLQSGFIVAQLALSLVLLFAAGQFIGSLRKASGVDIGFRTDDVVNVSWDAVLHNYSPERRREFERELETRLAALPGVDAVGLANVTPLGGMVVGSSAGITGDEGTERRIMMNGVSPGFFAALGIPIVRGRTFTTADRHGSERVAVINETAARLYWDGADAIGRSLRISGSEPVTVVGIARDARYDEPIEDPVAFVYLPLAQDAVLPRTTAIVHGTGASVPAVASVLRGMEPTMPLFDATTLSDVVRERLDRQTAIGRLLSAFGLAGVIIAAIGLYGVIGYTVTQRTREFGIRLALGATSRSIWTLVLRDGLRLASYGIVAGGLLAIPIALGLSSAVFGLQVSDAGAFITGAAVLALVVLAAAALPAFRAARTEPLETLRLE